MFIDIDDLRVHYEVTGEGHPILLLHGWGANLKSFTQVHKFLEKDFQVYAIDLPGFGESDLPSEPWNVDNYTDFLEKFIQQLKIENPILMGHSNGGRVSINYASRGNKVRKLILVDSAGIKPKRKMKYYVKVYTYKFCKNILTIPIWKKATGPLLTKLKGYFGSTDYKNVAGVMQQTLVRLVNTDLRHLLPKVKAPTLLVWGELDNDTPVSDGKLMEQLIPDAGLVVLKKAGHFSYIDKQHEFLIIIDNFLAKDKEKKND